MLAFNMLCYMMFKPRGVIAAIAPPPSIHSSLNKTLNLLFQVLQSCNFDGEVIKKIDNVYFKGFILQIYDDCTDDWPMISCLYRNDHIYHKQSPLTEYVCIQHVELHANTAIAVPQSFRRFYDVTLNLLLQVFISFKKLDLIFVFVLKINMVSQ